jgi:hypothetical protein
MGHFFTLLKYIYICKNMKIQFVPHREHVCFYYKDKPVNAVTEIVPVYCKTHMEHVNTLCGQNVV